MQRSFTTSRMQSSCWVNYDRPVSMHDTLRRCSEGGACTAITCHGQTEDHRHARTLWVHTEAYLPPQPGHVGCMALRRKPHLCSEALNPRCELALPLLWGGASPYLQALGAPSSTSDPCMQIHLSRAGGRSRHPPVTIMAYQWKGCVVSKHLTDRCFN